MDIKALEYSEKQQCFHFNTDTALQYENTNSYVTITRDISYEMAAEFVSFAKRNQKATLSSVKADFITFIQKH